MTTFPDDPDGAVLADLSAHGVDLSQPLQIDFFVAAADESSALAICAILLDAGYDARAEFDEGDEDEEESNGQERDDSDALPPTWTVYVVKTMVPDYDEIVRIQAELDRLSQPHGGFADGWGAMVE